MLNKFLIDSKDFDGPVLVTGAGGCIGSWVITLLSKSDIPVIAFDISNNKNRLKLLMSNENISKIKWITGNISNTQILEKTVRYYNIRSIIHLAALQIPFCATDPVKGALANVVGTVNIFEVARKHNLKRVAYTSSIAAHGLLSKKNYMATLYGAYKLCDENIAYLYYQDWGVPSIGIRPGIVYGIGRDQGMTSKTTVSILAVAAEKSFTIPFSGPISALYAGEVASALIKIVSTNHNSSEVFDMNGTFSTVEEWINILKKIQPKAQIKVTGKILPFPFELSDDPLRNYLGNYGKVNLEQGIKDTFNAFKDLLYRGKIFFDEA